MKRKERFWRTSLVYTLAPALFLLIAMMVILRPLTAYEDGFHGPDDMWRDILRWAHTGQLHFPSWRRATRDHLPHHGASSPVPAPPKQGSHAIALGTRTQYNLITC